MSGDRDWNKELAKIDRQIGSLNDEQLSRDLPPARAAAPGAGAAVAAAPVGTAPARKPPTRAGAYFRLLVSLSLFVAMLFWPYETRCGVGLVSYLASAALLAGTGIWSAVFSWRTRLAGAHLAAVALTAAGLVLGANQVLPRVGYSLPTEQRPAIWWCG